MDARDSNAREGGWGAVLDGVESTNSDGGADEPPRDGWSVIDALVVRASGGDAAGERYARVVAQIGAFVPAELPDAVEALLRVTGGASSWSGAVVDVAPAPPVVASAPDPASVPDAPSVPVAASAPAAPSPPVTAGPERATEPEPAPAPERAPVADAAYSDDPTFDAAIAASTPAEHASR